MILKPSSIEYKKIKFNESEPFPEETSAGKLQKYIEEHRELPQSAGKFQRKISILSDTHLLPKFMIRENKAFFDSLSLDGKLLLESEDILDAALKEVYRSNSSILFLTGDLSRNGEWKALKLLEEKLLDLKLAYEKVGRELYIFAVNGNHDMNNMAARDFQMTPDTVKVWTDAALTERIGPNEFKEIFLRKELMGTEAVEKYEDSDIYQNYLKNVKINYPEQDYASGVLSYSARVPFERNRMGKGLTVIGLDTASYSSDVTADHINTNEVEGQIVWPLIQWTLRKIREGKEREDIVVILAHHGFIPHLDRQDMKIGGLIKTWDFKYPQNNKTPAEAFADAGVEYIFTGHLHTNDISKLDTKEGNRIFDIETGSIVDFPSTMRTAVVTNMKAEYDIEQIAVETSIVPNVIYHNERTGEDIPIPDLSDYKNRRYFTSDRFVLFLDLLLRSGKFKEIQENGLRQSISKLLGEDWGEFIRKTLPLWLGTSRKHGKRLVNRYFSLFYEEDKGRICFSGPFVKYYIDHEDLMDLISNVLYQVDQQYLQDTTYLRSKFYELGEILTYTEIPELGVNVGDIGSYAYSRMAIGNENDFYDLEENSWIKKAYPYIEDGSMMRRIYEWAAPYFSRYLREISSTIYYQPDFSTILQKEGIFNLYGKYLRISVGKTLGDTLKSVNLDQMILNFLNSLDVERINRYNMELLESMIHEQYPYQWGNDSKFIHGRVL
ncbi:MAG: metallophosphoesterase [Gallicola sp.]|nr:metallophosphoesterase [Gallicola sp.]